MKGWEELGLTKEYSLKFEGGVDTVTGSRTRLTWAGRSFLIDCGLFQGPPDARQRNWRSATHEIAGIEAVILTHAHLDHCGFLPRLAKDGFNGPIYTSHGSSDLAKLILRDSAYLEEEFAKTANRLRYSRHSPALPLFTTADVTLVEKLLVPKPRHEWHRLTDDLSFRFLRAGHIVGSNIVQFSGLRDRKRLVLTFTGDLGHNRSMTMKDPEIVTETDILIMESTYGDRLHKRGDPLSQLAAIVQDVWDKRGHLVIPSFAVGRAQDLIYMFRQLEDQGRLPPINIYLDSPMAQEATRIFLRHPEDQKINTPFLDSKGQLFPSHFQLTTSPQDSERLCASKEPHVVISSSGMLSGGRILHHVKARIQDERTTILFTGYQAEGTKGRYLQELAPGGTLRIHHEPLEVRAQIKTIDDLSAHADYADLVAWGEGLAASPPQRVFLNHGSPASQDGLAKHLATALGWRAEPVHRNRLVTL